MFPREYKRFLTSANALVLAVGVIIGDATGEVVNGIVQDLIMPPIGMLMPRGDWRDAEIVLSRGLDSTGKQTVNSVKYGHLAGVLVDFVMTSLVVFALSKAILPKDSPMKVCPECMESIPKEAKRCRACTAPLPV